jgi:phage terminase large subunit
VPVGHPILEGARRPSRKAYTYPNGSTVVVGGLDRPTRIMSTEYDLAYVQEAVELTLDEWEALSSRLRRTAMPYRQLLADTNPDAPTHWLKRRCDVGTTLLLESRHADNPTVTLEYLATLERLTGPRYQRLRHGRWTQAEGVVYEGYDAALHLVQRRAIPDAWPRFLAVDFGYTNPFVCQWWALDPDGRLWRYREIYHTGRLVEDHARRIRALHAGEPAPHAVICDHDADGRATLERHLGWETTPAVKAGTKTLGLQLVAARLRKAGDGKPRLYLLRDSLDERDPALHAARKPCCTEEEFDSYVWDTKGGRRTGEEPLKRDDHGLDAARYMVFGLDGGDAGGDDDEGYTVVRT